ncbi:MAG TPA: hypothetical protein EYQ84_10405 [Nitrospinaceae bacterium]|jgi:hypothetical protein|nr:hypothetical protein [Nitrospinaceae bacterium]
MNKTVTALTLAVVFMFVASISSAMTSTLVAGQTGVCVQASWVAYNQDETKDTQLQFNVGPIGYGWGKNVTRTLAPGGFQANAIAQKTVFKNKGPGAVSVNCQSRDRSFFHDWKMDPGSGKTYQTDYHMDHVSPGTYMEPGYGMPQGTERGLFGGAGQTGESNR